MAKLSILIDDPEYTALKRKALDNGIRFQPWVRSAVLSLLGSAGYANAEKPHSEADELLLQSLHEIGAAVPTVANRLKQLIVDLARETRAKHGSSGPTSAYDASDGDRSLDRVAKALEPTRQARTTKKRA